MILHVKDRGIYAVKDLGSGLVTVLVTRNGVGLLTWEHVGDHFVATRMAKRAIREESSDVTVLDLLEEDAKSKNPLTGWIG